MITAMAWHDMGVGVVTVVKDIGNSRIQIVIKSYMLLSYITAVSANFPF